MILRTGSSKPGGPGASASICKSCCVSSAAGRDCAATSVEESARKIIQSFITQRLVIQQLDLEKFPRSPDSLTLPQSSSTPAGLFPGSSASLPAARIAVRPISSLPVQTCSCTPLAIYSAPQSTTLDPLPSFSLLLSWPAGSRIPESSLAAPARRCSG